MKLSLKQTLFGCGLIVALLFPPAICQTAAASGVRVELRLAESGHGKGLVEVESPEPGKKLYLHREALVTNKEVHLVSIEKDPTPESRL